MTDPRSFPFATGPRSEPPAEYAQAREEAGLHQVRLRNGRDALLVTRYQDVRFVLSDSRFSRSAFTGGTLFARSSESLPLITTDGAEHHRRRGAVAHAFTARAVRGMRPMVTDLAARQLDEVAAGPSPADLISGFTVPFTMRVMCRILGVPDEDMPLFTRWVEPMMSINRYPADTVTRCQQELHGYFATLVDAAQVRLDRAEPSPGLITEMLVPRDGEPRVSRTEAIVLAAGLLIAGYETTSNEMGAAIYHLLRQPALMAELRHTPDRIGPVTEEILRYLCGNGTGGVPHVATADVELGGVLVPAGAVVVPIPDAANRDPAVFNEPGCLRPDRPDNSHIAFGHGAHYCLGAELARLEMRVGIGALVDAFPELRIAVPDDELAWRTDMFVRGLWRLPVEWDRSPVDSPAVSVPAASIPAPSVPAASVPAARCPVAGVHG